MHPTNSQKSHQRSFLHTASSYCMARLQDNGRMMIADIERSLFEYAPHLKGKSSRGPGVNSPPLTLFTGQPTARTPVSLCSVDTGKIRTGPHFLPQTHLEGDHSQAIIASYKRPCYYPTANEDGQAIVACWPRMSVRSPARLTSSSQYGLVSTLTIVLLRLKSVMVWLYTSWLAIASRKEGSSEYRASCLLTAPHYYCKR